MLLWWMLCMCASGTRESKATTVHQFLWCAPGPAGTSSPSPPTWKMKMKTRVRSTRWISYFSHQTQALLEYIHACMHSSLSSALCSCSCKRQKGQICKSYAYPFGLDLSHMIHIIDSEHPWDVYSINSGHTEVISCLEWDQSGEQALVRSM